ncbi:MAG: nicotinamide riboside transporter PnuC, partial [Ferruginibacter sp.]
MSTTEIYQQFITDMSHTTLLEYVAVFAGIASVWYSRAENLLVYPVGLLNTIIYIYISATGHLLGEATVNLYYTIMSISGWYMWTRQDQRKEIVLHITYSNKKEWLQQLAFFL